MSSEALARLGQRWMHDPAFRADIRRDPEGTIERAGYQLDEDEWAIVRDTDWSQSDDDLQTRMTDVVGRASPPL